MCKVLSIKIVMTTPKEEPKAQTEQVKQEPTPESNVEVSDKNQKTQEIDEALNDSQKEQEMLVAEQDTKTEIHALEQDTSSQPQTPEQGTTTQEQTVEQGAKTQEQTVEQGAKTQEQTVEQGAKTQGQTVEQGAKAQEQTPQNLSDKEIAEIAKIKDNITLKAVANERIKKCEDLLTGLKWNMKSKNELKRKVNRAIKTDLMPMTKDEHIYETGLNHYKDRLGKIIFDYYTNREPARQIIMMWGRVPVINWTADTKAEAKSDQKSAKNNAERQIDFSEIKKITALYTLIWVNANEWWNYCDFIWQWWVAATHPVYVQHTQWFNSINNYNPNLYRAITPKWQITYNTYCQRDPKLYQEYCRNNNIVCRPRTFNGKFWEWLADMVEYFGLNKEKDPRKRQAWQNAWSLLALGWSVVLWFMFLKNLFSSRKENKNKWWKVAWRWAGLLALTNRDKVTKWVEDISWWHPAEKTRMLAESFKTYWFSDERAIDAANRYIWAPYTTMTALHFIPIYELESQKILEDNNWEIEFNYHNYENYVNKFKRYNDQKEEVLKAWKELNKQKSVWAWLRAFWITTLADLKWLSSSDKNKTLAQVDEVKTGRWKMVERVQHWVNEKLYNNWFRAKDTDAIDKIMQDYDKNSWSTNMNTFIKSWMDQWLLEFNGNLVCSMDELKADINMDNMTLNEFRNNQWENIKFSTYWELFEAANLVKYIKGKFKGVQAKSTNPFHIDAVTWRIKFDDTDRYELTKKDTNAVKYWTLKKNSTLFENRKFFVDYLNMQWLLSQ